MNLLLLFSRQTGHAMEDLSQVSCQRDIYTVTLIEKAHISASLMPFEATDAGVMRSVQTHLLVRKYAEYLRTSSIDDAFESASHLLHWQP